MIDGVDDSGAGSKVEGAVAVPVAAAAAGGGGGAADDAMVL